VEEFGLKNIVGPETRGGYWIRQTPDEDILLSCAMPREQARGGCVAYMMLHDLQLYVYLNGPSNLVEDMTRILAGFAH